MPPLFVSFYIDFWNGSLWDANHGAAGMPKKQLRLIDHKTKETLLDGTAEKPSREFGKLPTCAPRRERGPGSAGTAVPRSAAGRIKRHRQSAMPICGLQPSSAVVSAVASSEQASYHLLPHSCESAFAPLLLLSKSNPLRWASIWLWDNGRGHYLRTAFVLTWFKIKERQVSVYELLRNLKPLCRKGFTVL